MFTIQHLVTIHRHLWHRDLVGNKKLEPGVEFWWRETKRERKEKKNQRTHYLNAAKSSEERGVGTLLWVVGGIEEDGEGPLLCVGEISLHWNLKFSQGQNSLGGGRGVGRLTFIFWYSKGTPKFCFGGRV